MLWPFSNIVEKSWIADAGLRAGVARASASRRPWQIEETDACFILRDANGRALAYCDAAACSPATRHGGIAANIARIPPLEDRFSAALCASYLPRIA